MAWTNDHKDIDTRRPMPYVCDGPEAEDQEDNDLNDALPKRFNP